MEDSDNHKDIYLQPPCCADPYEGRMWSQDSAPGDECEEGVEWTHYVRADRFEKLRQEIDDLVYLHVECTGLLEENAKLQGQIDKVGKYIVEQERQWPYTKSCEFMFDEDGKFIEVEENE